MITKSNEFCETPPSRLSVLFKGWGFRLQEALLEWCIMQIWQRRKNIHVLSRRSVSPSFKRWSPQAIQIISFKNSRQSCPPPSLCPFHYSLRNFPFPRTRTERPRAMSVQCLEQYEYIHSKPKRSRRKGSPNALLNPTLRCQKAIASMTVMICLIFAATVIVKAPTCLLAEKLTTFNPNAIAPFEINIISDRVPNSPELYAKSWKAVSSPFIHVQKIAHINARGDIRYNKSRALRWSPAVWSRFVATVFNAAREAPKRVMKNPSVVA